jgi:hypothetical protein
VSVRHGGHEALAARGIMTPFLASARCPRKIPDPKRARPQYA